MNEVRVSFFRTATITDKPKGSFAKLADLGFVTGIGTLGINPSGPPGFPEYMPQMGFNNFNIGVPTLTTTQPNNTWMFSRWLLEGARQSYAQVRRRIPLPADQRTERLRVPTEPSASMAA